MPVSHDDDQPNIEHGLATGGKLVGKKQKPMLAQLSWRYSVPRYDATKKKKKKSAVKGDPPPNTFCGNNPPFQILALLGIKRLLERASLWHSLADTP